MVSSHITLTFIQCEYLSPLVLRKEVTRIIDAYGIGHIASHSFKRNSPTIFWNLIWHLTNQQLSVDAITQPELFLDHQNQALATAQRNGTAMQSQEQRKDSIKDDAPQANGLTSAGDPSRPASLLSVPPMIFASSSEVDGGGIDSARELSVTFSNVSHTPSSDASSGTTSTPATDSEADAEQNETTASTPTNRPPAFTSAPRCSSTSPITPIDDSKPDDL